MVTRYKIRKVMKAMVSHYRRYGGVEAENKEKGANDDALS